jgi:hypothetical protein
MKNREARKIINSVLRQLIAEKGFRFKSGIDGGFFRSIPRGRQLIGVPFYDYGATFSFSLVFAIRLDAVEEITNKFNAAPPKYHLLTETAIFQLNRFMPGEETKFAIVTEDDIKEAFTTLTPVVRERIIPFLDQTQDIRTVAKAMNLTHVPKAVPGANKSAIAMAWLTEHPDFEIIASTYQQRISQFPKNFQEELKNFIQYLRENVRPQSIIT